MSATEAYTDPTPQDVLAGIVAWFPDRDRRGHVVGWYVVTPRGDRLVGPFPTAAEATAECGRVSLYAIVACGWVFTPAGTIVSAS